MKFLNLALLAIIGLGTTCAGRDIPAPFTQYALFIDWSPSITVTQRMEWAPDAEKILARLKPGDAVALYPVHANTFSAKALFEATSLPLDEDLGLDEQLRRHKLFKQMRDGLRVAFHNALFTPEPTLETDLFGALDRCRQPNSGRSVVVVLFSDMLHSSSRDLDLEKVRLTEDKIGGLISRVGQARHWTNGMLAGVRVRCVLPGLTGQKVAQKNDPALLRMFWGSLFATLGANLERWDTQY